MKLITLGIETSCDETAAAVYCSQDGILSNYLFSQIDLHKIYGGVVPEIASRSHMEKIEPIIKTTLEMAQVDIENIDIIAVTHKPGLSGSLLIGMCFAKSLAWVLNKKLIGVDHIEGHIFSACIENTIPFPFLCITASGGHTAMYLVTDFGQYEMIGHTLDDAAGEAFDKVAKLINLEYPGGPLIESLASQVGFKDFFKYPRSTPHSLNFSFSGVKTAVLYNLVEQKSYDLQTKTLINNSLELKQKVASSLLVCISDIFEQKILLALKNYPEIKALSFVGGVACNNYIKQKLQFFCSTKKIQFFSPSKQYCTDNGAMIAFVGNYKAQRNLYSDFYLDIF